MPTRAQNRTIYGANKYAALHLLYARWLRQCAQPGTYRYVTLGGTEFRDFQSLLFIDPQLVSSAVSFEDDEDRFPIAEATAATLAGRGLSIEVIKGDVFGFHRNSDEPHLFFVNLEGTCALSDYHLRFGDLLSKQVLREGDTLFITSYLGRNIGWQRLFNAFDGEFRTLGVTEARAKKEWFRPAHPSFTLFRALAQADLLDELALRCIGCVEYRDRSPMAVYGYYLTLGRTAFAEFIKDTPHFHMTMDI